MTATDYTILACVAGVLLMLLSSGVVEVAKLAWRAYRRHRRMPEPAWEAPALMGLSILVGAAGGALLGLAVAEFAGLSAWAGIGGGVVVGAASGTRKARLYAERAARARLAGVPGHGGYEGGP